MDVTKLTIKQAREDLNAKKYSSLELTKAYIERIEKLDRNINAFVSVTREEAIRNAEESDQRIAKGAARKLEGIPLAIKDNFCTHGILTTASSKVLEDFIPPYDATVVRKLKDAGMVLIGKTNMDAWAHGSSTETSDFGTTRNPWNRDHLPGGSSGGSAAAVAADFSIAAIGSETAGSIRQPASWCGIVGLKPTYGRVSRYGVVAMASSLDSPGPMTKTVEDAAYLLNIIAGKDPLDATTSSLKVRDYTTFLKKDISGITIGISDEYFIEGMDGEVRDVVENAIEVLKTLGAKVKKIKLFDPEYAIAVYTILQRSEVSSNLARYDGVRFGHDRSYFGEEAKRRIMLGTYALSAGYYDAYYKKAQEVRTVIVNDFKRAFQEVDVIIGPTSPTPAQRVGVSEGQSMFGELADVLVEPSSIAGLPGINITCGFSKDGLPIGMQIIAKQFDEETILPVAFAYEQETKWSERKPQL